MPVEIGRYARGIMSLLELRSGGVGPQTFSEQVVGVVDLSTLYLLQAREVVTLGTQANPVVGNNVWAGDIPVPLGEMWYVWNYTASVSPGVGEAADIALAADIDGAGQFWSCLSDYVSATANQNARAFMNGPFWAGTGTRFGFLCRSLTLQPDVGGSLTISRLRTA